VTTRINAVSTNRNVLEETRGQHALDAWKRAIDPNAKPEDRLTGVDPNARHTLATWRRAIEPSAGDGVSYKDGIGPLERAYRLAQDGKAIING
jgi:hypothetical protein